MEAILLPFGDIGQCLERFWLSYSVCVVGWGESPNDILWMERTDAAEHPTVHKPFSFLHNRIVQPKMSAVLRLRSPDLMAWICLTGL